MRRLCDEVFGEENFLAQIVWQKKYAATNDAKGFSTTHDYIVVYQKSTAFERNLLPRTAEMNKPYIHDDNDDKGLWRSDNLLEMQSLAGGIGAKMGAFLQVIKPVFAHLKQQFSKLGY